MVVRRLAVIACLVALLVAPGSADAHVRSVRWSVTHTRARDALCPVAGDFNRDGRQDLLTASDGYLQLWPGRSSGRFAAARRSGSDGGLLCPTAVGDFDRDGRLDAVGKVSYIDAQSPFDPNALRIALGAGHGRFRVRAIPAPDSPLAVHDVAAADFNRDGRLDIVVLEHEEPATAPAGSQEWLRVGLGNGRGRFDLLPRQGPYSSPRTDELATSIAVADVDGDQLVDVVIAENLLMGRGNGTFVEHALPDVTEDPALADLDGDGRMDVVFFADTLDVLGASGLRRTGPPLSASFGTLVPAVADFTGDGHLDVLALDGGPVLLYRGDGRGGLAWPQGITGGEDGDDAAVADFNRDGVADVAVLVVRGRRVVIRVRLSSASRSSARA